MRRTHPLLFLPLPVALMAVLGAHGPDAATTAVETRPFGAFTFRDSVQVPLGPEEAFDEFVKVDAWWDHRFSESPVEFRIDARPGGGFVEVFDEGGNGVLHATVIAANRGKLLRMNGPLGLSGYAVDVVYSLEFDPRGQETLVRLEVRGAGELEDGWADAVQAVWHHFLAERFKPYVEGRLR